MGESIAHTSSTSFNPASPDYVIYTFRRDDDNTRSADLWQNMGSSKDINQAREKARTLFRSSRYSRIELRKKFVSEKTGAVIDVPVEILGKTPDTQIRNIIILLSLAMGCALLALSLSVLLG